jgi:lipopolysaccharide export system protein LptA
MKLIRSLYLILITILLLLPYSVYSETAKTNSIFDTQNGQINITSISYELDMKNSSASFTGDVKIVGNDMGMTCQKLVLFFSKSLKDSSTEEKKLNVEKIVATGSVVITRTDRGTATAEKAVYFNDSEKIVLTGNPVVKDKDRFEGGGNTIIMFLKEDRYVVEGSKDDKARLFATDKEEER